jgi:catalase
MHMITACLAPGASRPLPFHGRFGVNTYKMVNAEGVAVLVKYHWVPKQGVRNLTQAEAQEVQAANFNHATQDLYDAIERGEHPEWELNIQVMSDGEHPELDFDPLDPRRSGQRSSSPSCP